MSFHVQCEMVRAGEGGVTHPADVRFVAGVLAVVATKFVGPSETPITLGPRARERLLTCTHVSR